MFPFHSYTLVWKHNSRFYSFRFKLGNWLAILINYYNLVHNYSQSYHAFKASPLTIIISKLISSRVNGLQQNQRHQELTNKRRWARKICHLNFSQGRKKYLKIITLFRHELWPFKCHNSYTVLTNALKCFFGMAETRVWGLFPPNF